ncbi:Lytic murein transglycosylase [Rhodoferax ferrireducens T118]|uniref:Lytic murein transglycosylase n=1 Tax=Albidiferax ferrireducens (strain ATCC BAA-621 / DSM 15236 / T118) TaxID=338969 RepID=Q222H2_ALBFT|nr:lytic murein transglycosylase [Rhodoferax ferrireducens]ABD68081.1 Lytic murein transglycosylase [Rhodoferax ferrireducens T118]
MATTPYFFAPAGHGLVPALLAILALAGCASTPSVEPGAAAPSTTSANPTPAGATPATLDAVENSQKFARWVAEFSATARTAGIDEATLHIAFDNARFLPRVIESDRAQPEFTRTPWDYLDTAVSALRVTRGQDKLLQLRQQIDPIAVRYGVPTEVLLAIWGMESSYGSFVGDLPTIDALATLGFEGRREAWARNQLLVALKILQSHDIVRVQMVGSWAGAMGQTQFLPSVFLAYAVDADGDGRRDIWGSVPDVMASTANFLVGSGWQAGQPWGAEVRLPPGFDYARTDADVRQPTAAWVGAGVQAMDGTVLPSFADGSILLPAGARGPAFLVGSNFRTILRYNNSTSYALGVHLLAQRLAGGPAIQAAWPRDLHALTSDQMLALQTALNARGFDSGTPNGKMGPATQRGIRRYQRSLDLPTDGYPTLDLLQRLQ